MKQKASLLTEKDGFSEGNFQKTQQDNEQTKKEVVIGSSVTNYEKVKASYKKIHEEVISKKQDLDISEIYNRIQTDLKWDSNKRPTIRQLVARFKREISNDKETKSEK